MTRTGLRVAVVLMAFLVVSAPAAGKAQSLRGSRASMHAQNRQADLHDFTRMETPAQVRRFVELGLIVRLHGNRNYRLHNVGYPYARPEVKMFVERLSSQYRAACGEELVVTSLTRPKTRQPRNASPKSVHSTGMAVDLRRPNSACRPWLERVLMSLEGAGVVEATRERRPPHYHVAIYPEPYKDYVAVLEARKQAVRVADSGPVVTQYRVRRGDTLWKIARAHDTTVGVLKSANNLRGAQIYPGELLNVPVSSGPTR